MTLINKKIGELLMEQQDQRARLQPKSGRAESLSILGPRNSSNILFPLYQTGGVLFPYTPAISTGSVTEYDNTPFIHSNYNYNAYVRSYPKPISITAEFTAQSNDEALYLLAVIHFFRSVTKSYFGVSPYNKAGTPPPTLVFNYLGEYQFNNVPVVVKYFDYSYEANIDYVPVNTKDNLNYSANMGVSLPAANSGGFTWVPTHMTVSLELETQYIPIQLRNQFNLDDFRSGKLVNNGYI
jgi:hypothetical protein